MPLPLETDSLDAVPEAARAFYVETGDGRFRLDAVGIGDIADLQAALERERDALKALTAEAESRENAPAEVTPPDAGPPDAGPPGTGMADAGTSDTDMRVAAEAAQERIGRLEAALIGAEARAAIHAEHGIAELLMPVVVPRLTLTESADGGYAVVLRGGHGASGPGNTGDGKDMPMTPRAFVQSLQASRTYGRAFEIPARGGSGAPSLGQAGPPETVIALGDQNGLDRNIAAIASGRVRVAP